jgi:hypothetical protein
MQKPSERKSILSGIRTVYMQPISTLLIELESVVKKGDNYNIPMDVNTVKVSPLESAYSASIILLSVVMLESILAELKTTNPTPFSDKEIKRFFDVVKFFKETFLLLNPISEPEDRVLLEKIETILKELFVVRNVIAHSHIWEIDYVEDDSGMRADSKELQAGYGNVEFQKIINEETKKTQMLLINLIPIQMNRRDVVIVLKNIIKIIDYLKGLQSQNINVHYHNIKYRDNALPFDDFVNLLWEKWSNSEGP